jgi:hypothetical protein
VKSTLLEFLRVFWSFKKHIQDEYLRQVSGKGKERFFLGKRMGPKCLVATLGLGSSRFARVGEGRVDRRYKVWGFAPRLGFGKFDVSPQKLTLLSPK